MASLLNNLIVGVIMLVVLLFAVLPIYAKWSAGRMKRNGILVQARVIACDAHNEYDQEGHLTAMGFHTVFQFSLEGRALTMMEKSDKDYPVGDVVDCYYWPGKNRFCTAGVTHSSDGGRPYLLTVFSLVVLAILLLHATDWIPVPEELLLPVTMLLSGGMVLAVAVFLLMDAGRKAGNDQVISLDGVVTGNVKQERQSNDHWTTYYTPVYSYHHGGQEHTLVGTISSTSPSQPGQAARLEMDLHTREVYVHKEVGGTRSLGLVLTALALVIISIGALGIFLQ